MKSKKIKGKDEMNKKKKAEMKVRNPKNKTQGIFQALEKKER